MKPIYILVFAVLFFVGCSTSSDTEETQDDPAVVEQEMKSLEDIKKREQERLDSFKKANGITD